MHQYSSTSARKSGRQSDTAGVEGTTFARRPKNSGSTIKPGLTGRRISSDDAGVRPDTLGIIRTATPGVSEGFSSAPPLASAFFCGFGFRRLLGPRQQRGLAPRYEHVPAAIEARERPARNAREHLAGVAIDVDHF